MYVCMYLVCICMSLVHLVWCRECARKALDDVVQYLTMDGGQAAVSGWSWWAGTAEVCICIALMTG